MDNYDSIVHEMKRFGIVFRDNDLPLKIDSGKTQTCGKGGKYWYKLYNNRRKSGTGQFITGSYGRYGEDKRQKITVDWEPMTDEERLRQSAERAAKKVEADKARQAEAELAALDAQGLWRRGAKDGTSPYLVRKGVLGEACRYLPDGSLLVPLLRYDYPREQALRAVQRIFPDGAKRFTAGFIKAACAVRLGEVLPGHIVLVCEGYATGLTLRMACDHTLAVYVALDAGNLQHVVPLVRELHQESRILICADDDYRTKDFAGHPDNVGRKKARAVAKTTAHTDILYPIFEATTRGPKDTDFNDLHARQGLETVSRQLGSVLQAMRARYG